MSSRVCSAHMTVVILEVMCFSLIMGFIMSLSCVCSKYSDLISTTLMTVSCYIKPSMELYTCGILDSVQKLLTLECF